jgi:hypothetical protein
MTMPTHIGPVQWDGAPSADWPKVLPRADAVVSPDDLAAVLGRLTVDVGRGRAMLENVDERLRGLVVSLDVFRVIEGPGALIGLGVVTFDPAMSSGATTTDLWKLAREALVEHRVARRHPGSLGGDAVLADYGETALVTWLRRDRLLTVSVTRLNGDPEWAIQAARSIVVWADDRVALQYTMESDLA